jgi:hypothetical protein
MNETKKNDDEKVNPKSYIKKGVWISLGAAAGICLTAASIMNISKIPACLNGCFTAKDSEYCSSRIPRSIELIINAFWALDLLNTDKLKNKYVPSHRIETILSTFRMLFNEGHMNRFLNQDSNDIIRCPPQKM